MKKYLYLLIALCTLGACSDFLDETPKGTLIPKTVDDFALMMEDNDPYGGYNNTNAGPTIVTMLDDDIKITDSPVKLSRYSQAALRAFRWEDNFYTQSENDDNYNELYHCIYNCNYILENVETAEEGGAFTRDYVRGAACFHRAFAYFCLVNMYAPHWDEATAEEDLGVPLALRANINDVLDRSTVAEVYEQIFKDLAVADTCLNETEPYPHRPTIAAVQALYARIYLYQGKYEECWKAARKAREITGEPDDFNQYELYDVLDGYEDANPDNGIDGLAYDEYDLPDIIIFKGGGREPNTSQDYNLSDELVALFDKGTDLRWYLFVTDFDYDDYYTPGTDEWRITSFQYPDNPGLNVGEVWITEAEALCREGDIDGALNALNTLARKRHREGTYVDVTERDPDTLLRLILEERRRELMFKSMRWFDLKRLNKEPRFAKTITHVLQGVTYTLEPNSPHYAIPFPLKAINANPSIEQNTYEQAES